MLQAYFNFKMEQELFLEVVPEVTSQVKQNALETIPAVDSQPKLHSEPKKGKILWYFISLKSH